MAKSARTAKSTKHFLSDIHTPSCVSCAESRLEFSKLSWIRSTTLKTSSTNLNEKYCPQINNLAAIGKIRSRFRAKNNQITDVIGKYMINDRKFYICHDGNVIDFDFCSILNIDNPNSYIWVETKSKDVYKQKYTLRVSYDTISKNVYYAGTTDSLIGTSTSITSFNLFAANDDTIEILQKYEILCLRPSPASLRQLSRLKIRQLCRHDNAKIKKLQQFLSEKFINYLKYPCYLKCGQCLLREESIISDNFIYRLSLLADGRLLFYINNDFIFLYDNVDCLNFNEFRLIVNFNDKTSKSFVTDFENATVNFTESKLFVSNDGYLIIQSPYYDFKYIIQFRDDLPSFLNLKKPEFVFSCFYESIDEDDDDDDTDSDSDDSELDFDDSDDEDDDDDDGDGEIHALSKTLIGNRTKSAIKK